MIHGVSLDSHWLIIRTGALRGMRVIWVDSKRWLGLFLWFVAFLEYAQRLVSAGSKFISYITWRNVRVCAASVTGIGESLIGTLSRGVDQCNSLFSRWRQYLHWRVIINTEATWIWVPDNAGLFSLERNWWRTLVLKYRSLRSSRGMNKRQLRSSPFIKYITENQANVGHLVECTL